MANGVAFDGIVEQNHQLRLGRERRAQFVERFDFRARGFADGRVGVLIFADVARRHDIDVRIVVALVGANLEGEERMFQRQVGADDQESFALVEILRRGELAPVPLSASISVTTSPVR